MRTNPPFTLADNLPPSISTTVHLRLPVLPWVRKFMLKEYGPEPLRITGRNLLGKHLQSLPFDLCDREDIQVHGCTVLCSVSVRLWASVTRYSELYQAGYYYEKVAQRMMIQHMSAFVRAGSSARAGMFDWMDIYCIGEDDYAAEAAYELWKAYKAGRKELSEVEELPAPPTPATATPDPHPTGAGRRSASVLW